MFLSIPLYFDMSRINVLLRMTMEERRIATTDDIRFDAIPAGSKKDVEEQNETSRTEII